jgi:modification methylase
VQLRVSLATGLDPIGAVQPDPNGRLCRSDVEEVRAAFGQLVSAAGEALVDERRRHMATVRPDGTLKLGPAIGSIHKIGALAQGLPACNGWTYWHAERKGGLVSIDAFRAKVRAGMGG